MAAQVDLREIIDRIHERIEIESLIGRRVRLQRRGSRFLGLCPFHAEKTPSFTVTPDRGRFKCFGCGKGGDAITYLQETEGLEFWDALRQLADEAGIELPQRSARHEMAAGVRAGAREALARARKLYAEALQQPGGRAAREYLAARGLQEATLVEFGVGWAPGEPGWLAGRLQREKHSTESLLQAGLVYQPEGSRGLRDRFWDRVIFPICDAGGRTVGFGGRYLPGSRAEEREMGKYINSPDGPLFPKGRLLYGIDRLREGLRDEPDAPVLVAEGYLDVALLHQAGLRTSVAALGTSLTEEHARRLRRFERPVVLVLDADPAGRKAAARAARLLVAEGVDVRVAELPEGEDPADLVATGRTGDLRQRLEGARDIIDWRLDSWVRLPDFRVPAVQARAAKEVADWAGITPNPALADVWIRLASDRLGVTEESLRRMSSSRMDAVWPAAANPPSPDTRTDLLTRNEREITAAVLLDPSLLARHRVQLEDLELRDSAAQKALKWCLDRREKGLPFDLGRALEDFMGDPAWDFLDGLRSLEMAEPRTVLERALESLPANQEHARRLQRREGPAGAAPPADDDLARYRRQVRMNSRHPQR